MSGIHVRRFVNAPPEKVFTLAANFAGVSDFISGITKVEMLTDGPVGKGTRFRETRVMFGREATEEMTVTEFDPPSRYVLVAENHGCRYRSELTFTAHGEGTELEMNFEATPLTLIARIMSFLMKPMAKSLAKCIEGDLDDLKRAVEGEDPVPDPAR